MRIALTSITVIMLGCVYSPAELGRYETSDEGTDDPSGGSVGIDWNQAELCKGKTLATDLGHLDVEVNTFGAGVHPFVIEVLPIEPSTTLPGGLVAEIHPLAGEAAFETTDAGLRYEGDLQLGWSLLLHADQQSIVEVRARIDESSIDPEGDAASATSCENEWLPSHPFWGCIWTDPPPQPDPACGLYCGTYESSDDELGYAYCPIPCEDVGDCAAWDPAESAVACDEGECRWYCEYDHDCPSDLDCHAHVLMGLDDEPYWGRCMAPYPSHSY